MSRSPSPLILVLTLGLGLALGLAAGRLGPVVSAQQAATGTSKPPSHPPAARAHGSDAGGEDAVYRDLAKQYETVQHFDKAFALVSKVVSPAVVHIVSRKASQRDDGTRMRYEETGSGVIVRNQPARDCYVLTNNHVVEGAQSAEINIYLHDGRVLKPERCWSDAKADVAVLKLGRDDLPAARLGDSDNVMIGHWVLALGSPFGLTHSVSQGIISARGRHEQELEDDGVENQDFLQTDAAINPGNSGGPLVNLKGEVIGINTAIASQGGGSEGVGFSIPINLAKWIMSQLVSTGRVSRGAIGVKLQELLPQKALDLGLDRPRGARIGEVSAASPAALAGIRNGDVVLRYNGIEVVDLNHLINLVSMTPIGQTADVVFWRDRKPWTVQVTIADRDGFRAKDASRPIRKPEIGGPLRRSPRPESGPDRTVAPAASALGIDLLTMDAAVAHHFGLPETVRGAAVSSVDPASPLATLIRRSDVITAIGGRPVQTAEDVTTALKRRVARDPFELSLLRSVNGTLQQFKVQVP
jgi:serine protease Do